MKKFGFTLSILILYSSTILGQEKYQPLPKVDTSKIWHSASIPDHNIQYDPLINDIISQTNLDTLITYVRILSGEDSVWVNSEKVRIQHRVSGLGNDLAADYLKQKLETFNLKVYDQIYSASGRNIYAIQPGYIYPEKQYIVCAHYDAVDDYCADDNASGVAAVLETARILSGYDFKYTLVYGLWDEEEIGLVGSHYYASQVQSDQLDIQGVLNMDMLGWDGNGDGLFDIHTSDIANSDSLANLLLIINSIYNLQLNPVIYNPGTWQSDHSSFWDYGYGAILLIEAYYGDDLNPYYHSSQDRINRFDLDYFHNLSRLAIGAIITLAGSTDDTLITRIVPDKAYQNSVTEVDIQGYNTSFATEIDSIDVWLSRDAETITADSIIVHNDTLLTAFFSIPLTATPGIWLVNVETSVDGILTKTDGFEIIPLPKLINVPDDYASIQEGIDAANNGDTVLVQPDTYVENISFNGKNIVVGSLTLITGDNSYIYQTIIDGSQPSNPDSGSVVYFISGEDTNSVLTGFTITGGSGTWINPRSSSTAQAHGGGIFIANNSNPVLANLIVRGNVAESANGAGICCINNSNPRLEYVKVIENNGSGSAETNDGSGGILLNNSSPILKRVEIYNNTGMMSGGMYCCDGSNPILINVTISDNKVSGSDWYSTVAEFCIWGPCEPILINTIIWNDSLPEILLREYSSVTAAYSDIQNGPDSALSFNGDSIFWLEGNINADPMFVSSSTGDYRLAEGSPCINKGIQDTIIVYNKGKDTLVVPAIAYLGSAPDMGAYEFDPDNPPTNLERHISQPDRFTLHQNYPNPFNPKTVIRYALLVTCHLDLSIYNILGQKVATLVNKKQPAGRYEVEWDASGFATGVYYYKLTAGDYQQVKKMVLIK
jgi:hypothetical protein